MTDIGDLTGKQLGHFKIHRKLGAGGMAVVYKAHELSLNRTVALKVIGTHLMEDESFVERFQREAQAAARINHPNIVQIYSIGEDEGLHYFAMEYVDGRSLEEIIAEEGFLTVPKALPIIRQVAAALAEAHDEDIVHRDIKPANVMIDRAGRVKVADFGIAFMQTEAARLTQEGAWVGTPKYVSPEQCRGETVDGRSDIYSLGVTLYELLSGRAPFDADTPAGLVMQIVKGESEPIRAVNPTVPGEVGDLIDRMIALDPADRFQGAEDLVAEIERMEDRGLTTASRQVHPGVRQDQDEEDLPPTVVVADADEDRAPEATEVLSTDPGETEVAPSSAEAPREPTRQPEPTRQQQAEPTRAAAAEAPSEPTGEAPDESGSEPAGAPPAPPSTATQEPAPEEGGSSWTRIGIAAAAVVILALIGVIFAVQLSGASRSESEPVDVASPSEAPVADAGDAAVEDEPAEATAASSEESPTPDEGMADPAAGTDAGASPISDEPVEAGDEPPAAAAETEGGDVGAADGGPADGATADATGPPPAAAESSPGATDDATGARTETAGAQVETADRQSDDVQPAPVDEEPEPTLPPADSVVLTTSAEGGYGDMIHSLVESRLLREDFDVVDADSFPGARMADLARVHLETTVSITGRERVSAYGVTVDKVTVSLGIRAVSLLDGRTLATTTDSATYTPNDAEQKLEAAIHRLMRDTVQEIRRREGA